MNSTGSPGPSWPSSHRGSTRTRKPVSPSELGPHVAEADLCLCLCRLKTAFSRVPRSIPPKPHHAHLPPDWGGGGEAAGNIGTRTAVAISEKRPDWLAVALVVSAARLPSLRTHDVAVDQPRTAIISTRTPTCGTRRPALSSSTPSATSLWISKPPTPHHPRDCDRCPVGPTFASPPSKSGRLCSTTGLWTSLMSAKPVRRGRAFPSSATTTSRNALVALLILRPGLGVAHLDRGGLKTFFPSGRTGWHRWVR